jgi:flagellar assembly protein FliH
LFWAVEEQKMPSFDRIIPQELASQFVTVKLPSLGNDAAPNSVEGLSIRKKNTAGKDKPEDPLQTAYKKGYSVGYNQAQLDAQALLNARVTQLAPLLDSVHEEVAELQTDNARRILHLAVTLAEQIVRAEVKTNTGPLVEVIRESLILIAESVSRIQLHVHPADAEAVREEIGREEPRINVVEDQAIAQGGCRIVTSQGDIDATLKRRINTARIALGLEPAMADEGIEHALSGNPLV